MSAVRFVAYYRTSTNKQNRSGLGLNAQRAAVAAHVVGAHGAVAADFIEIESGRKKDRPSSPRRWPPPGPTAPCW